jgi:hypothetical protein
MDNTLYRLRSDLSGCLDAHAVTGSDLGSDAHALFAKPWAGTVILLDVDGNSWVSWAKHGVLEEF